MELKDYVERIKLQLTGGVIELEINDKTIERMINATIRELNNYYNVSELIEVPGSRCIDLTNYPQINNVVAVHRPAAISNPQEGINDPSYVSYLQTYNFGANYFNPSNMVYNITNYTLAQQISNTLSTDLDFRYDEKNKKLYINYSQGIPSTVVLEVIPRILDASDVLTQHWQDILYRLSLAEVKIALGRVRTRYRPTETLYEDDGETILAEGVAEAADIRAALKSQADLVLPLD